MIPRAVVAAFLAVTAGPALAYPEGAPWTAADPDGAESCGACHYDGEAVRASSAIRIDGLPRRFEPRRTYRLTLRFEPQAPSSGRTGVVAAGFLVVADGGCFGGAGEGLEATCEGARSTAPVRLDPGAAWVFDWTAPDAGEATLWAAANAVNDDASPFGDAPHYRAWRVTRR